MRCDMKRVYSILHVPGFDGDWCGIPAASIDTRPWEAGGPLPPAEGRIVFDGSRLLAELKSWETNLSVVTHETNGPVWEDSCIELFMNPAPGRDSRYLNFELNAEGVMLLGFGKSRHDRSLLDFDPAVFAVKADVPPHGAALWRKPFYTVRFAVPVSFLEGLYGPLKLGRNSVINGNFQKCGEKTPSPHYGCWNPILTTLPDFHCPEYFGEFVIA